MMAIWNDTAGAAGAVSANPDTSPSARRADARRRFKDTFGLRWGQWEAFCARVAASDFLTGKVPPTGKRKRAFRATIDWVLRPANATKIIEGNYDNRPDDGGGGGIGRHLGWS